MSGSQLRRLCRSRIACSFLPAPTLSAIAVLVGGAVTVFFWRRAPNSEADGLKRWTCRYGLLFVLGWIRAFAIDSEPSPPIDQPATPLRLEGTIVSPPIERVREGPGGGRTLQTAFHLRPLSSLAPLRVLCRGRLAGISGGDLVVVHGALSLHRPLRNPGSSHGVAHATLVVDHRDGVRRIGPSYSAWGALGWARDNVTRAIECLYAERPRGTLLALLLGDRRLLAGDVRRAFEGSGLFHLLALSGLHVGLLMAALVRIPLPRRMRFATRFGLLLTFTILSGGSPAVVRAAMMLSLHLLLARVHRAADPLNSLGWTALLLLLWDPTLLRNPGFQLSFTGVFFLLTYAASWTAAPASGSDSELLQLLGSATVSSQAPHLLGRLAYGTCVAVRVSVLASIAAWIGTAPLVLFHFQRLHLGSPIWNALAAPLMAALLMLAGISLLLSCIHPGAATAVASLAEVLHTGFVGLLEDFAAVPGSMLATPRPAAVFVVVLYAVLVIGLWTRKRTRRRRRAFIATATVVTLVAAVGTCEKPTTPDVWVFDVGAADAFLLSSANDSVLIDAGAPGPAERAGRILTQAALATGTP